MNETGYRGGSEFDESSEGFDTGNDALMNGVGGGGFKWWFAVVHYARYLSSIGMFLFCIHHTTVSLEFNSSKVLSETYCYLLCNIF